MKLFSVAIGEQYELEAQRLQKSINPLKVEVFTKSNIKYIEISGDPLINGLWHKCNFANYIDEVETPVVFMDADMFTLNKNPFEDFKVKEDTDFAYVPYKGKWHLPDNIRQKAFEYHGHKINSGFMYFRNLQIAKSICNQWQHQYLEREKLYDVEKGTSKYEYDEWALMIALQNMPEIKIELLDSKWNDWELGTEQEILNSDSIFFQSHDFLDIIK
jgi:hypothetical protein